MCLVACLVLALAPHGSAAAEPRAESLCVIDDERLHSVSGLAADGRHWYAVNDGGTRLEIYVLGRDCRVRDVITAGTDPFDVEDLARAPDGTLWLSDTGDNRRQRDTVALHELTPDGDATLYRLTYPDGPHDAEALVLDHEGVPHIVTKAVTGTAGIYRPGDELSSPGPTPLDKVATVAIGSTDTQGGPVGTLGTLTVTGGATSADGTVVVLRTYTDAYLYAAPDRDVVAALQREPVRIPLPGEPQGEAVAVEPDGTMLSTSEGVGQPVRAVEGAAALARQHRASERPGTPPSGREDPAEPGSGSDTPVDGESENRDWGTAVPAVSATAAAVVLAVVLAWARRRHRSTRS
ncbi:hypothetical protein H0B56_09085 [Haloechinothrix sp. YIM 98757]|uniref:Esterase-like activity of phytase n=1 Tax=Haloechinothrix aidingensis TaxID=2752311 RepID=A0A838A9X1_9PSEU|nr:hypothetical protein [Haloechinothrix aidingensis]